MHSFPLCCFQVYEAPRGTAPIAPLPRAHTCFCILHLPLYKNIDELRTQLLKALEVGLGAFGIA